MNTLDALLSMSDKELREHFKEILNTPPDPEFHRRCEERRQNIENDFETEWSKKHSKWFFKKYRQKKLLQQIELRYPSPVLWIIEDIINETLPDTTEFFGEFVDFKGE